MSELRVKAGFPGPPNPSQTILCASLAREILGMGPPGCGKSWAMYVKILMAACKYPGNQCAIGRRQLVDLKETTVPDFFSLAPKELFTNWVPPEQFINRSPMMLRLHNGSMIHFKGFHDSGDAGSANWGAVGLQEVYHPLGGVGITHDVYLAIDKALRCPRARHRFICSDTNQAPPDHWLHKEFGDSGRPGHEVVFFNWEENKGNLPEAHVEALETEWRASPMLAELLKPGWREVISGKAVYGDLFQPHIHVAKKVRAEDEDPLPPEPDVPIIRSWDPSFVQPWVTFNQIVDRQWRWLGECLPSQVFLPELISEVELYGAEHFPGCVFEDVADDAVNQRKDTGRPIDTMRKRGIFPRTQPVHRVRDGIEVIVDYLTRILPRGRPAFRIHERCTAGRQCLGHGYRWVQGRDDRLRDVPLKDGFYDGGADAARYLAINKLRIIRSSLQRASRLRSFADYSSIGRHGGYVEDEQDSFWR